MKTFYLLFAGITLCSSLFAQRAEYNQSIINDDREGIIKYGEQLLSNGEANKELYRRLANTYKDKNSYSKAIDYLSKAYLLDSNDVRTAIELGNIYQICEDEEKALDYYIKASDIDSSNTYALSLQLRLFFNKGNMQSALIRAQRLCMLDSSNFVHFRNLGLILQRCGQANEAMEAFQKAIDRNSRDFASRIKLCNHLINTDQHDKATKIANEGLTILGEKRSRNAIVLRRNLALIQYRQQNADTCIYLIKQLWADGDTIEAYTYKLAGYSYLLKGFYDDAVVNLKVLYSKSPDGDSLQFQLPFSIAQAHFNLYELKESKKHLDIAIRNITPNQEYCYNSKLLLGEYYSQMKKYREAIDAFEEAITYNPTELIAYTSIVSCYKILGYTAKEKEPIKRFMMTIEKLLESGATINSKSLKDYKYLKKYPNSKT